jgi:class 3 adenylate cyclase
MIVQTFLLSRRIWPMPIILIGDLLAFAQKCLKKAENAAKATRLSTFNESVKVTKSYGARLLADEPRYSEVETFRGIRAWGALLAFDLRKSSARALELGARDTYLTMHTYLPTMLSIIDSAGGIVVGLRGDGAIACFGLIDQSVGEPKVSSAQATQAVRQACQCGDAIVKAIDAVVNKVLMDANVRGGLQVGVGIDVGNIVATNIGIGSASELTAYGNCVNKCCERSCGNNAVILTLEAKRMFPKSKGGKTEFRRYKDLPDAFILRYPPTVKTLR